MAREIFRAEGFCGLEQGDDFYLTDGASLLHLQAKQGQGEAHLAPHSGRNRCPCNGLWAFSLLKLLRPRGFYSLHAAGLVTPAGRGGAHRGQLRQRQVHPDRWPGAAGLVLPYGMTLTCPRPHPVGVAALALRKHCYVRHERAGDLHPRPSLGQRDPDRSGRQRWLTLTDAYPESANFTLPAADAAVCVHCAY